MSIDTYKKRLERFGSFVAEDVRAGRGRKNTKTPVEQFADEIDTQSTLFDHVNSGGKLSNLQLRRKWWYQFGNDPDRLLIIPKYKGKKLEMRDLFGADFIVDRNKIKPAFDVLKEMNEKLYFEKQLNTIETAIAKDKADKTKGK